MENFIETKPRRDQFSKPKKSFRGGNNNQSGMHYEKKRPQTHH